MRDVLVKILLVLAAIFAPAKGVMISALTLILADLITGVIAAHKRGEPISSAGFQRTLVKIAVYEVAIALGFVAEHYLMGDTVPIMNMLGGLVGLTELTSCYENLNAITGTDLLKSVISALKSKNSQD